MLAPGAQQPGAAEGKRREGGLEEDPLGLPLVDVVALHDALPAAHLLLVAGTDPRRGVDVKMAAQSRMADARAKEQLRRAEGPAGSDHGLGANAPVTPGRGSAVAAHLLRARGRQT